MTITSGRHRLPGRSQLLRVHPSPELIEKDSRRFAAPSSKPETQRALILAALAPGRSTVGHPLRCSETDAMIEAATLLGARFTESGWDLVVDGVDPRGRAMPEAAVIQCQGSGFVSRVFAVLATALGSAVVLTGDRVLRTRDMGPLLHALARWNRPIDFLCEHDRLPVVVRGGGLAGGCYELPGDISSQFVTALLIGAPLAQSTITIDVRLPVLSSSYLRQTVAALRSAGISVDHNESMTRFAVEVGPYRTFTQQILGDYTSASYCLLAAALAQGQTTITNLASESLQGERMMVDVLRELGIDCRFNDAENTLTVGNGQTHLEGEYEFDVRNAPNIAPTLAVLGAFVEGVFRVTGGSITRLHKSPRVRAMVTELRKLGVDIVPLMRSGVEDGFEVHGRHTYSGGATLSSWSDHRIFMSLFVATLRMREPNLIDGYESISSSFPTFLTEFARNGSRFAEVSGAAELPDTRQDQAAHGQVPDASVQWS